MSSSFNIYDFNCDRFNEILQNGFLSKGSVEKHNRAIYLKGYLTHIDAKSMLVENDYTDGDYLDDFAAYYVRCHQDYSRRCKRIHFFSISIEENQFLKIVTGSAENSGKEDFQKSYLGFIVVRPLPQAVIGRTVLKTYNDDNGRRNYTCVKDYSVNLFGIELTIEKSLAFQEQDTVIAACATVSLWCCFHKTAEMFGTPAPRPAAITRTANQVVHHSRSFPSNGLVVEQMCDAIRQVGLEPEVFNVKRDKNPKKFPLVDLIYGYLKMGLPVILASEIEGIGFHAITLLGFSIQSEHTFPLKESAITPTIGSRINKLYAHDDQNGPFSEICITQNHEENTKYPIVFECAWNQLNRKDKITLKPHVIIIPVYNKIRVTFLGIQKWINVLHEIIKVLLDSQKIETNNLEWNIYLFTSNELKSSIKEENISQQDKKILLLTQHPRFIWRATLSMREKNDDNSYRSEKIVDFLADATDIPHGFPIYQALWYQEELRSELNDLMMSEKVGEVLAEIHNQKYLDKYLDKYTILIDFIKKSTSR
ncbi:hypothetical protein [Chamaesiphon polymorphus]|uniref:Uncharacterized protein n=1 Tax=Chamaesiphon polymorphus CCALA 037 TaxID=2107692 RepID=A0A2T1GLU9_9CYAN|nr:hypothetical protein [Chamaesiphon polymorphus]PSB58796.1 hypothetical protein C7B77_03365 [Chamaesiphon polymorphus CCALA 037]